MGTLSHSFSLIFSVGNEFVYKILESFHPCISDIQHREGGPELVQQSHAYIFLSGGAGNGVSPWLRPFARSHLITARISFETRPLLVWLSGLSQARSQPFSGLENGLDNVLIA